jgi:hypothetical protein
MSLVRGIGKTSFRERNAKNEEEGIEIRTEALVY